MSLTNAQDAIRRLIGQRAADSALVNTVAAHPSALRASAESMLGSSLNMGLAHMAGSVDIARIQGDLQSAIARFLAALSGQYGAICTDMIDVLGNAGAGGVNKNAIKSRKANAASLRSMLSNLTFARNDIVTEYGDLLMDFRQALLETQVLDSLKGTSADAAALGSIITDLDTNLRAGGHDFGMNRNDKVQDLFEMGQQTMANRLLTEYETDYVPALKELTYDKLFDYFQHIAVNFLEDLNEMIEVYEGATSVGRTPPEETALRNMREMEGRLCRAFRECILRVFSGNVDVFLAMDGVGETFPDIIAEMSGLSPPLHLDDAAGAVPTNIPSELRKLRQYIKRVSAPGTVLGGKGLLAAAMNRGVTSPQEAAAIQAVVTAIAEDKYAADPAIKAYADDLVFGTSPPSIGWSDTAGTFKSDIANKINTSRAGS